MKKKKKKKEISGDDDTAGITSLVPRGAVESLTIESLTISGWSFVGLSPSNLKHVFWVFFLPVPRGAVES